MASPLLIAACERGGMITHHLVAAALTEPTATLGTSDGAVPLSFLRPWKIASDDGGRTYVLASTERRVYVIDPEGRLIKSLGHEGRGPAEFEGPEWIEVTDAGDVVVGDMATRRIVR